MVTGRLPRGQKELLRGKLMKMVKLGADDHTNGIQRTESN
jgi:hypothetical protein